jgi:hypothetical protein
MAQSSKRQKHSKLWNFFTPVEGHSVAICNVCKRKLSYKSTSSNLKKHLTSNHPNVILPSSMISPAQPSTSQPTTSAQLTSSHASPKDSTSTYNGLTSFIPKKVTVSLNKIINDKHKIIYTRFAAF